MAGGGRHALFQLLLIVPNLRRERANAEFEYRSRYVPQPPTVVLQAPLRTPDIGSAGVESTESSYPIFDRREALDLSHLYARRDVPGPVGSEEFLLTVQLVQFNRTHVSLHEIPLLSVCGFCC